MSPPPVHPLLLGILRGSDPETLLPHAPEDRDWEQIIGQADAHGVIPLLYDWLRRGDVGRGLPATLASRLERQFFGLAARNMLLGDELRGILGALEGRRVPCAPLRGLALAERLHGNPATRSMGDIDLLVRKEDLAQVRAILRDLGFREVDRRAGFAQAFAHTLEFFKDRHGWIIVEPHWTIAYPPFVDGMDMERVWQRCVRGRVLGVETWLLSPEDLLLHLCLHLTHRGGTALPLWFYEIDRLVRQEQGFDWSRLAVTAREAKLEFLLAQSLGKVRALFGTPLPDPILALLAGDPGRSMEGRLMRLLAGPGSVDGKESLAVLLTLRGFLPKLKYALALLFPSPEFMRLEYNATSGTQLGLAYARRFCYLSREGLKGVAKLLA